MFHPRLKRPSNVLMLLGIFMVSGCSTAPVITTLKDPIESKTTINRDAWLDAVTYPTIYEKNRVTLKLNLARHIEQCQIFRSIVHSPGTPRNQDVRLRFNFEKASSHYFLLTNSYYDDFAVRLVADTIDPQRHIELHSEIHETTHPEDMTQNFTSHALEVQTHVIARLLKDLSKKWAEKYPSEILFPTK